MSRNLHYDEWTEHEDHVLLETGDIPSTDPIWRRLLPHRDAHSIRMRRAALGDPRVIVGGAGR